jgi:hypothetical protein
MRPRVLSRRALLRGAGGLALGLPHLDAMAATTPPVRLMTFFWPNGAYMEELTPSTTGADYALPRCLQPLKDLKSDFLVITGLKNVGSLKGSGDSHEKGRVCFGSGLPSPSGQSAGGPTIDQYAAQKLGSATRFPSLVLTAVQGQGANSAYMSWAGPNQPVPADIKPSLLFAKLFSNGLDPRLSAAEQSAVRARRRSVLDFVTRDTARLTARLGAGDRQRLDAHVAAVRDIERRIALEEMDAARGGPACRSDPPPPDAKDDPWQWTYSGAPVSRQALLEDLLVAAFRCDLTRFASMKLSIDVAAWIRSTYGDTRGHHDISHDGSAKEIQAGYTGYQLGFLASLMAKLKAVPEGGGSLLDATMIYASSEISHGGAHNYTNMPVLLAGRGGGRIRSGRHIDLVPFDTPGKWAGVSNETWTDLSSLFLTLLQIAGVTGLSSWGEAQRPLDLA